MIASKLFPSSLLLRFCSAIKLEPVVICLGLKQVALNIVDARVRQQRAIIVALAATFGL